MKFKVGDRVRIKSIDWYNENKDIDGCIGAFVPEMSKYCGEEAIIEEVSSMNYYSINLDEGEWDWTDEMLDNE